MHLKHGRDTNILVPEPGTFVHPDDFSGGPDEHFGTVSGFRGKRHLEIQHAIRVESVVGCEIDASRGDVTRLAGPRGGIDLRWVGQQLLVATNRIAVRCGGLSFEWLPPIWMRSFLSQRAAQHDTILNSA